MKIRRMALLALAGYGVYLALLRSRHLHWGADEEDEFRSLPGDDLVPYPKLNTTRAVDIQAPASDVWQWVVQIGNGRGGLYSYDWLENLFSLNFHSADRVVPELQRLKVGDTVSLAPENGMPLAVVAIDPPHVLVLRTGESQSPVQPGDYFQGQIAGTWAYILEDVSPGESRLIVRWRADWRPSAAAWLFNHFVLEPAHFIMERRMLLGIKERAEAAARTSVKGGETGRTAREAPASMPRTGE